MGSTSSKQSQAKLKHPLPHKSSYHPPSTQSLAKLSPEDKRKIQTIALSKERDSIQQILTDETWLKDWRYRRDVAELEKGVAWAGCLRNPERWNNAWLKASLKCDMILGESVDMEHRVRQIGLDLRRMEMEVEVEGERMKTIGKLKQTSATVGSSASKSSNASSYEHERDSKSELVPPPYCDSSAQPSNSPSKRLTKEESITTLKAEKVAIRRELSDKAWRKNWQYRTDVVELAKDEPQAAWVMEILSQNLRVQKEYDLAQLKYDEVVKEREDKKFRIQKIDLEIRRLEMGKDK